MKKIKNGKGFTLIELLVTVLIVGILAAIAIPKYNKSIRNTLYASMLQMLKAVVTAEQSFYITNNTYTKNWSNLDISFPTYGACTIAGGRSGGTCRFVSSKICMCLFADSVSVGFGDGTKVPGLTTAPSGYEYVFEKIIINQSNSISPGLYCRENNLRSTSRSDYHCKGTLKRSDWHGSWFKE